MKKLKKSEMLRRGHSFFLDGIIPENVGSDEEDGYVIALYSSQTFKLLLLVTVTHAALVKEVPKKALEAGHHLKTANTNKVNGSNNNISAPVAKCSKPSDLQR
ncbi:hypothetical protein POM88_050205 [Heracleum sosnowskyi]|uniref:Uncharacterized protein n=1 Tax=Heracleum sosnowskyi TaxID=360622 RepID=A0AAD8GYC7_9APIA|nr:hypothetical protein POM88_050205 [Heracleum sosnowskyi]